MIELIYIFLVCMPISSVALGVLMVVYAGEMKCSFSIVSFVFYTIVMSIYYAINDVVWLSLFTERGTESPFVTTLFNNTEVIVRMFAVVGVAFAVSVFVLDMPKPTRRIAAAAPVGNLIYWFCFAAMMSV